MRVEDSEKEEEDFSTKVESTVEDFEIGKLKEPFVPKGHEDHIDEQCKGIYWFEFPNHLLSFNIYLEHDQNYFEKKVSKNYFSFVTRTMFQLLLFFRV